MVKNFLCIYTFFTIKTGFGLSNIKQILAKNERLEGVTQTVPKINGRNGLCKLCQK